MVLNHGWTRISEEDISPVTGLQIGLEFFFEGFAAAMDKGFGRGEGGAQDFGDLFVA